MKKRFIFPLILLLVFVVSFSCSERSTNPPEQINDITNPPGAWINALAVNSNGDFFAGTSQGLFKSSDKGTTWHATTISGVNIEIVKVLSNDVIITASAPVFNSVDFKKSTDDGTTWNSLQLDTPHCFSLEEDQQGNIYACIAFGLFKSTDEGESWVSIYPTSVFSVSFPTDSMIIIGVPGDFVGEIKYSTDTGTTWQSTGYNANVYKFFRLDQYIFAGSGWGDEGGSGVHRSADNGLFWLPSGLEAYTVSSFTSNKFNHLICGTNNGIYLSITFGNSWENVLQDSAVTTLMRDGNNFLYAGTFSGTFLRSTNDGMTWRN